MRRLLVRLLRAWLLRLDPPPVFEELTREDIELMRRGGVDVTAYTPWSQR